VRRSIDSAALQLFAENGYRSVTTDQIAEAAGVSPSTYYRHVPSKEDLVLGPIRASSAAIVERFADIDASTPEDDLITAIRDQTQAMNDLEARRWRTIITGAPDILDRVHLITDNDRDALIAIAAHRLGRGADDWHAGVLVATVLAVVEYGYRRWMTATDQTPLIDYLDTALTARTG